MTARTAHDVAITRCRAINDWIERHPLVERLPILIALLAVAVVGWRGDYQADTSSDRDQARLYQRCEQARPTAIASNYLIARSPELRDEVRREAPESLNADGRLTVPDCVATYPRGSRESHRFPDAVQPSEGTP